MKPDPYNPPAWLRESHFQLVCGPLLRSRSRVAFRRERVATADGDEIFIDHVDAGAGLRPRLLVLHGLEGSSYSVYVQGLLALARDRGWNGAALNFRSCARDPAKRSRRIENQTARLYHSGDTADLDFVLNILHRRDPSSPLVAAGGSLGGNVLLKWLGENPGQTRIRAAAAISTPFDLAACARSLESPIGRVYVGAFLRTLRPKARSVVRRFPVEAQGIDLERVAASRTFFQFDDAATAPLHGFAGAADYYRKSSSIAFLPTIETETLCVCAEDDPFLPAEALSRARDAASRFVEFRVTARGSHLGFLFGGLPPLRSWAEETAIDWLGEKIG